jgi:hypothetical protein
MNAMMSRTRYLVVFLALAAAAVAAPARAAAPPEKPAPAADRWPAGKACDWYQQVPRPCGFNFLPSTAVNTTEMWQADTFDAATIDRELGWAEAIGFNSCRVFIQYLVWQADPERFLERFDRFLRIAAKHRISVMPVLFDDCAFSGKEPYLGKQDAPVPGVHNSGWTASPGHNRVVDRKAWPDLERYVTQVVGRFASDRRVIAWDLYNEPTNGAIGDRSLPLAEATFAWARRAGPSQPITLGVWNANAKLHRIALDLSDVVTFHNYGGADAVRRHIADLKVHGRPVICTEWMRRPEARFETHLPVFKAENVGWYSWGLVNGKTQTHLPWGSKPDAPDPPEWFHDLLRKDGTPLLPAEVEVIRQHAAAP